MRNLRIGICGSHRTGKTTLATEFSSLTGMTFLRMPTSTIAKEMGIDVTRPVEPIRRMALQNRLYEAYTSEYQSATDFVSDRTPIDLIAYTLIEGCPPGHEHYVQMCVSLTFRVFTHIVYIPPVLEFVNQDGSAAAHQQLKIDLLIRGALQSFLEERQDLAPVRYLRLAPSVTKLEDRVRALTHLVQRYKE